MSDSGKKFRLITRSDFDGLVCAVLLKDRGIINDILFVHPKDMQDGLVPVTENDISTNLPFVKGIHIAFDHHLSETHRIGIYHDNHIIDAKAPSAARVVYDYYGGDSVFSHISKDMMKAVDKADSAKFTMEDVLDPKGWELLSFLMDARTGLGRFREFKVSNYTLMMDLINYCRNHEIEDILKLPDVIERIELYKYHTEKFKEMISSRATTENNVLIIDLRNEETIFAGNRFIKYAMFPGCNIDIQIMWGRNKQNTVCTVGKSIFNKTSEVSIGSLMLEYGGGGHYNAGTCQLDNEQESRLIPEIISRLKDHQ